MTAQRLGDQDQYIEGVINCALAFLGLGALRQAMDEADRAIHVAQLTRDHERWSVALSIRSLCRTGCRQTPQAIVDAKQGLATALRHGAHRAEVVAQRAIASAYLSIGNLSEANYHIDQAIVGAEVERLAMPHLQFMLLSAQAALHDGQREAAITKGQAVLSGAELLSAKQVLHDCNILMAQAYNETSEWSVASSHASRAAELAGQMHLDSHIWRSQSALATALINLGDPKAAEAAFGLALGSLEENRCHCLDVAGADTLPDDPAVTDLWKNWIMYLKGAGRPDEAANFIEGANWPTLEIWFQERGNDE